MVKFYYEDVGDRGEDFFIIDVEGGHEHGQYFDVAICIVAGLEDAESLCKRLNQLWNNQK